MCFTTLKNGINATVANKPVVAFKLMKPVSENTTKSPYQSCTWKLGIEKVVAMKKSLTPKSNEINRGLHCFQTPRQARAFARGFGDKGLVVVPVLIPKGAYFYKNKTQYVSNRMILLGTDTKIFRKVVSML